MAGTAALAWKSGRSDGPQGDLPMDNPPWPRSRGIVCTPCSPSPLSGRHPGTHLCCCKRQALWWCETPGWGTGRAISSHLFLGNHSRSSSRAWGRLQCRHLGEKSKPRCSALSWLLSHPEPRVCPHTFQAACEVPAEKAKCHRSAESFSNGGYGCSTEWTSSLS